MDREKLKQLLLDVQEGRVDISQALDLLRHLPFEDIGHSRIDYHRQLRKGLPEVIYCENKTVEQAVQIFSRLKAHHDKVLATRVSSEIAEAIQSEIPEATYHPKARLVTYHRHPLRRPGADDPLVLVVSAGTSDQPVAEEAAETLTFLEDHVERAYDVGVAGIHRLLEEKERLFSADVIITVAGMEGALTSVVGGLVDCPVIGVPTSVGYGANFSGLAPLLTMLNSCASGVAVVNIDNGFGAAVYAHLIVRRMKRNFKS